MAAFSAVHLEVADGSSAMSAPVWVMSAGYLLAK